MFVVIMDAGRTDSVDVVRRDAIGIFFSSNKVVDTFISAGPGTSDAAIPNAHNFSVFSGKSMVADVFFVAIIGPDTDASHRADAAAPDSLARLDIIAFTVNLSFGVTNNGDATEIITGD